MSENRWIDSPSGRIGAATIKPKPSSFATKLAALNRVGKSYLTTAQRNTSCEWIYTLWHLLVLCTAGHEAKN
jgi:hypothetical protein